MDSSNNKVDKSYFEDWEFEFENIQTLSVVQLCELRWQHNNTCLYMVYASQSLSFMDYAG